VADTGVLDEAADDLFELAGRLPCKDMRRHVVENPRGNGSGLVHAGKIFRIVNADAVPGEAAAGVVSQGCALRRAILTVT